MPMFQFRQGTDERFEGELDEATGLLRFLEDGLEPWNIRAKSGTLS